MMTGPGTWTSHHGRRGGIGGVAVALAWCCLTLPAIGAPAVAESNTTTSVEERAAAIIATVEGRVWIQRPDSGEPLPANLGLRLQTGDEVLVDGDSAATIYFSGGHIVRIPGGSRLEIVSDPSPAPAGSSRVARMSARSLKVLEKGLWMLSDPAGGVLLGAMRGSPSGSAEEGPLSPRNETITNLRPDFYLVTEEPSVRIVVGESDRTIWRSGEVSGSILSYPKSAPPLEPGHSYQWWFEALESGSPLSQPVPFKTPGLDLARNIAAFESEMESLGAGANGESLSNFLRCAFYEQIGAWSRLLRAANGIPAADAHRGFVDQVRNLAGHRMGLSRDITKRLFTIEDPS